jgi:hypothetical protein
MWLKWAASPSAHALLAKNPNPCRLDLYWSRARRPRPLQNSLSSRQDLFNLQHNTNSRMDTSRVSTLLEQLDGEIDDLEESLAPLVATALSDTASKLPLLDKAKLYVLVTYAIESVLFCEYWTLR